MNRSALARLLVAIVVLALAAPAHAAPHRGFSGGGHFAGPSGGHFTGHRGFDGHRFAHRGRGRIFVAPFFFGVPFVAAPVFVAPPPVYWYYCPSYGGYYPSVPSCPEPWVPVPAA